MRVILSPFIESYHELFKEVSDTPFFSRCVTAHIVAVKALCYLGEEKPVSACFVAIPLFITTTVIDGVAVIAALVELALSSWEYAKKGEVSLALTDLLGAVICPIVMSASPLFSPYEGVRQYLQERQDSTPIPSEQSAEVRKDSALYPFAKGFKVLIDTSEDKTQSFFGMRCLFAHVSAVKGLCELGEESFEKAFLVSMPLLVTTTLIDVVGAVAFVVEIIFYLFVETYEKGINPDHILMGLLAAGTFAGNMLAGPVTLTASGIFLHIAEKMFKDFSKAASNIGQSLATEIGRSFTFANSSNR